MQNKKIVILFILMLVLIMVTSILPSQLLASEKIGEVTGNIVNVRQNPGTQHSVIAKVTEGQFVTILEEKDNWFRIKLADGKIGWMAGWLLDDQIGSGLETAIVSKDVVNIRQGPGTTYAKLSQVKAGDKLTVLKKEKDWYLVRLPNGKQGWVANWLVQSTNVLGAQVGKINGSAVNVRKGANTTYPLLFQLNKDEQVTIKEKKDGWYLVESAQGSGWIAAWLVNTSGSDTSSRNAVVTGSIVNVRQEPTTSAARVTQVKQGEQVEIIGQEKDWYKVKTATGKEGWIANWLISLETSVNLPKEPEKDTNPPQEETVVIKKVLVTGSVVNIRKGSGLDYAVIDKVRSGTELSVLAKQGDWLKVQLNNGNIGWIAAYLTVDKDSSPLPQPQPYISEMKLTLDNEKILILKNLGDKLGIFVLGVKENQYKIGAKENQLRIEMNSANFQTVNHPLDNWGVKEIKIAGQAVDIFFDKTFKHQSKYSTSSSSINVDITYPAEQLIPVKQIKLNPQQDQAVVQIAAGKRIEYTAKKEGPNRLVIDLPQSSLQLASQAEAEQNVAFGPIRKVTSRQLSPDLVRVEAELAPGTQYQVSQQDDYIVVGAKLNGGTLAGKTIVIDPGHGSIQPGGWTDPGAIGKILRVAEREVNLDVALQVRDLLTQRGAKVIMTHSTGRTYLSLAGRADVANNHNADIFVSIHANSNNNRAIQGTSVYYYAPTWHSELASQRWLRQRLALSVQDELVRYGGRMDLGIMEENFAVLRHTKVPSILVEMAFLSNQEEERLLSTKNFRTQMALGIFKGIEKYFQSI